MERRRCVVLRSETNKIDIRVLTRVSSRKFPVSNIFGNYREFTLLFGTGTDSEILEKSLSYKSL